MDFSFYRELVLLATGIKPEYVRDEMIDKVKLDSLILEDREMYRRLAYTNLTKSKVYNIYDDTLEFYNEKTDSYCDENLLIAFKNVIVTKINSIYRIYPNLSASYSSLITLLNKYKNFFN